ncbi:MAG: UDP-N-acetylglucosamine 2-epimerase (non-hydrolyzing) [Planctomycetota bacterium]|nr:MAG: UDP-N-acetylglucosamine 2-epimerase (non-hydrolyzing) [Planctomycetota bacterium]
MAIKILTILGARPHFVKAGPLSQAILQSPDFQEIIVHTGQHFDKNMSRIFFEQLSLPPPTYHLNVHSLPHGAMIGRILEKLEPILLQEQPHLAMVYGDTNTSLAGALASVKCGIPLVHIEAGMRCFNMKMTEEINRVLIDRISSLLICSCQNAVDNLHEEGFLHFPCKIALTGDIMRDSVEIFSKIPPQWETPLEKFRKKDFILTTIHRAENTDQPQQLSQIVHCLNQLSKKYPICFPIHPRTKQKIKEFQLQLHFPTTPPVGYLQMLHLLQKCRFVITDSGGLQKESYFLSKPSIILRNETEWQELVQTGYHTLIPKIHPQHFLDIAQQLWENPPPTPQIPLYGKPGVAKRILKEIQQFAKDYLNLAPSPKGNSP